MKIVLDLPSALVGGSLVAAFLLLAGAQTPGNQSPTNFQWPPVVEHVVKVKGIPAPGEQWAVYDDTFVADGEAHVVFTVPDGKTLVVTAGWAASNDQGSGLDRLWLGYGGAPSSPLVRLPTFQVSPSGCLGWEMTDLTGGVAFPSGSDVLLFNQKPPAASSSFVEFNLLGYLTDAE